METEGRGSLRSPAWVAQARPYSPLTCRGSASAPRRSAEATAEERTVQECIEGCREESPSNSMNGGKGDRSESYSRCDSILLSSCRHMQTWRLSLCHRVVLRGRGRGRASGAKPTVVPILHEERLLQLAFVKLGQGCKVQGVGRHDIRWTSRVCGWV